MDGRIRHSARTFDEGKTPSNIDKSMTGENRTWGMDTLWDRVKSFTHQPPDKQGKVLKGIVSIPLAFLRKRITCWGQAHKKR